MDTNYFTVDQTLLAFGVWPDSGGFLGPGGGVIRLDPGLTGAGFNPLVSVGIFGATTLPEGSTAIYFGRAKYANNYQYDFTNTPWSSTVFTITNGIFTVGSVDNDTLATLTATYSSGGISYKATTNILILNVPPANLSQPTLQLNTNFVFSLQGAPNRKYVIEVTSDLRDPVIWLPASTNTIPASGSLSITNSLGSDAARFFRAREAN